MNQRFWSLTRRVSLKQQQQQKKIHIRDSSLIQVYLLTDSNFLEASESGPTKPLTRPLVRHDV